MLIHGYNASVGTSREDLADVSATALDEETSSAVAMAAVSASANDAAAGTGMRTGTVFGLNANYDPVMETFTLNGMTQVLSIATMMKLNGGFLATAGSGGVPAGVVSIQNAGATKTYGQLIAGINVIRNGRFTAPAKRPAVVRSLWFSSPTAQIIDWYVLGNFDEATGKVSEGRYIELFGQKTIASSNPFRIDFPRGLVIPPTGTVKLAAISAASTAACYGMMDVDCPGMFVTSTEAEA